MFWATATAAGMGVLLGLWFRVNALIAGSIALLALSCVVALFRQQPFLMSLAFTYAVLVSLQSGYIVGVALACAWPRLTRRLPTT
jgi:ABC-type amino acid transport system permease subunit